MSLLPQTASFEERVAECFLAFRGGGLMLSPLDSALVREWNARGVPFEVVARGIERAAEHAERDRVRGQPLLRSLRACTRHVERELRHHLDRAVGVPHPPLETPVPFHLVVYQDRCDQLRTLARARPDLGGVTERLLSGILARPAQGAEDGKRQGDGVAALLARALPRQERLREVRREAFVSARARVDARRMQRVRWLREHLGLTAL